jgi:hypothetical protein
LPSESVENKGSALQKVAKSSQNAENTQLESKAGLENRKRLIFRGLGVMRQVRTRRNTEELARAAQPGATSVVTTIPYFTINIIRFQVITAAPRLPCSAKVRPCAAWAEAGAREGSVQFLVIDHIEKPLQN